MTLRYWLRHLGIFAAFFVVALLVTFPLVTQLGDGFIGFPYGDAYENARHMWWMAHALRTGQPLFFQPLLAYPDGIAGLTLQASPLMVFPGWLLTFVMPLPVAYNLHMLLTLALNGWAMYGFTSALTGRRDAALLAGVVFMSYPALQGHLGASHLNIITQWGVPLYAWGLWRLTQRGDANGHTHRSASTVVDVIWVAVAFLAVAWAHTIQVIYAVLPVTAFFLLLTFMRRDWSRLALGIGAAGAGAALTLLWVLPLFGDAASYHDVGGAVRYSADLLAGVTPSFFHPLWGALPYTRTVLGVNLDEGAGYVGLIASIIASIGVWQMRAARPWLWLALALYILSLGPLLKLLDQVVYFQVDGYVSAVTLPWALLSQLPGFDLARTPGRFNLTTGFAVAVMVAFGAAWILPHMRRAWLRGAVVLLCGGLILFDYQTFAPIPMTRADIPQAIYDLREQDDVRAVFDIPWNSLAAKDALYLQTAHQLPMVHGQVTRRTPVDPAKLALIEETLDPALLEEAGADIIIVHKAYVDAEEQGRITTRLGAPIYEDDRFAIYGRPPTLDETPYIALTDPDGANTYFYLRQPSLLMLDVSITGETAQTSLMLNEQRLWEGACAITDGGQECRPYTAGDIETTAALLRLPALLPTGYSTLALSHEPPCPTHMPLGLRCQPPSLSALISEFSETTSVTAVFGDTIHLDASRVIPYDGAVEVWLVWAFDSAPRAQDIRFVHLLDGEGQLVAQVDSVTGAPSAGGWSEVVSLAVPDDLPSGEYRVEVGWYSLPDVAPIGERIEIGRVTLP